MMTTKFETDKEYLRTEAKSPHHAEKSKWFFSTLTNEQKEKFKEQWYQTMETMEINIPMFTYFDIYAAKNNINYPFAEISMFQKDWNTYETPRKSNFLKKGKIVISVKIQNFSRSRMTKQTSPLESSREI